MLDKKYLLWDTLDIFVFILLYWAIFFSRIYHFNIRKTLFICSSFLFLSILAVKLLPFSFEPGIGAFIPSLFLLSFISFHLKDVVLIKAFTFFFLSIIMRLIDNSLCSFTIIGTHFLWHIFCAVTIYYLMMYMIKKSKKF